jgi:hypothetical protein
VKPRSIGAADNSPAVELDSIGIIIVIVLILWLLLRT